MKGWIYKISHQRTDDNKNGFPGMCYVGQHRGKSINERFTQHKREARNFEHNIDRAKESKFAKLHEAMRIARPENFIIEELEEIQDEDINQLILKLNAAELKYQKKFNSINEGWNIVDAPQSSRARVSTEKSIVQIANENGVTYSSLIHRINNIGETIEEAVNHLKNYAIKPKIKYEYKRQVFQSISSISNSKLHNKYNLDKKTIERRIKELKNSNSLKLRFDKEKKENIYILIDEIFNPKRSYKEYSVKTPEGDILSGLIIDLHKELIKRFPKLVPEKYTTIQSRLKKENWNTQQAFGFEYPPDLMEIKPLIEKEGYKWAISKPDFKKQNSKPVVLKVRKEIFVSQDEFSNTYGLAKDLVSDHLNAGKTPEAILDFYDLNP